MAKLIYIGGYGRSGSTLLEYLLSSSDAVLSCGEVASHFYRSGLIETCTCGRVVKDCPIWSDFQHTADKQSGWDHSALTMALLSRAFGDYAVMVDSSKTAWRTLIAPFRFNKHLGDDFLLIHLVRDPRGVCWSTVQSAQNDAQPSSSFAFRSIHTTLNWVLANAVSQVFGWCHRDRYMRLRYEDLVHSPLKVVNAILEKAALPPVTDFGQQGTCDNRHQLYGNSIRFLPLGQIKESLAWKADMPTNLKWLVWGLSWPLALPYGYGSTTH